MAERQGIHFRFFFRTPKRKEQHQREQSNGKYGNQLTDFVMAIANNSTTGTSGGIYGWSELWVWRQKRKKHPFFHTRKIQIFQNFLIFFFLEKTWFFSMENSGWFFFKKFYFSQTLLAKSISYQICAKLLSSTCFSSFIKFWHLFHHFFMDIFHLLLLTRFKTDKFETKNKLIENNSFLEIHK